MRRAWALSIPLLGCGADIYYPQPIAPFDGREGAIPVGNLSCVFTRTQKRPTILEAEGCEGPGEGAPFRVVLVFDL